MRARSGRRDAPGSGFSVWVGEGRGRAVRGWRGGKARATLIRRAPAAHAAPTAYIVALLRPLPIAALTHVAPCPRSSLPLCLYDVSCSPSVTAASSSRRMRGGADGRAPSDGLP